VIARRHLTRAARSSAGGLLRFGIQTVTRRWREKIARRRAAWEATYCSDDGLRFTSLLDRIDPAELKQRMAVPDAVLDHWSAHQFDLLGSGWKASIDPGTALPAGPNADIAAHLSSLLPETYRRIDWHADLKSGHRWERDAWWLSVPIPVGTGADIKLPWELARCCHLPVMALAALARNEVSIGREVRNQIIDFIAANPPMFGVNWRCAMDVAIRGANFAMAASIIDQADGLDEAFENVLARSLTDHGRYVFSHLEWYPDRTGNHYLADITGLAIIAAALDPIRNEEARRWLVFAEREITREILVQFLPDGGQFEGSVPYHRFCLEMAVWGMAACLRAGGTFPEQCWQRIAAATSFLEAATKPCGNMVQIGDNDSGRFLNLAPRFDDQLDEVVLDPSGTLDAAKALLSGNSHAGVDALVVQSFCQPHGVAASGIRDVPASADLPDGGECLELGFGPGLDTGLTLWSFPDFGLHVIAGERLWLSFRCGGEGDPIGAHRHNDQLSVEIQVDGRDIVRDPGTFCYTPDPDARNRWRSIAAHFAPQAADGREPADLNRGQFFLDPPMGGVLLAATPARLLGRHDGFGSPVWREVRIESDRIIIRDVAGEGLAINPPRVPDGPPFSPGYGRIAR
jgi:hypothetical protein